VVMEPGNQVCGHGLSVLLSLTGKPNAWLLKMIFTLTLTDLAGVVARLAQLAKTRSGILRIVGSNRVVSLARFSLHFANVASKHHGKNNGGPN